MRFQLAAQQGRGLFLNQIEGTQYCVRGVTRAEVARLFGSKDSIAARREAISCAVRMTFRAGPYIIGVLTHPQSRTQSSSRHRPAAKPRIPVDSHNLQAHPEICKWKRKVLANLTLQRGADGDPGHRAAFRLPGKQRTNTQIGARCASARRTMSGIAAELERGRRSQIPKRITLK